jgi:F-type H+-transporting ATPase subunit b
MLFISIAHAAEETAAATGGIGAIGLDVRSLLFQILNFAILLFLLQKFAYKPIVKVLEDRKRTIDESMKNAKDIENAKADMATTSQNVMHEAREQAQTVIKESKQQANDIIHTAEAQASEQAKRTIEQAQEKITQEMQLAKVSLKQDILGQVADSTEKIIKQKLDGEHDEAIVTETLNEVSKQ